MSEFLQQLKSYFLVNEDDDKKVKHSIRVTEDLRDLGFSAGQLRQLESRRMPEIIRADEQVKAAVFGRAETRSNAVMVATDKRVIYFDHTPFLDTLDEFNYAVVSGISHSSNGFSWSITIHTKIGDRNLQGIKTIQARQFINYIESSCIDQPPVTQ